MSKIKFVLSMAAVGSLAVLLVAQEQKGEAKKGPARRGGILHPEMTVENGTWDKPMGTLGEKPAQPWSATTFGAAVNGKPQPGRVVTRVGEIVDFSCYLQVGKHGEKHRACGQKCVQNGQPIGLLTREGTLYMLMPEEHDPRRDGGVDLRPSASDHMAHIMEVHGTETMHNGYRALFVTGVRK